MAEDASRLREANIRRRIIKRQLTSFKKFLETLQPSSETAIAQLSLRVDKLMNLHKEFDLIQSEIEIMDPSEVQFQEREDVDTTFFALTADAKVMLNDGARSSTPTLDITQTSSSTSHLRAVKLPAIQLPIFEGNYESWLNFRDTFTTLVHNNEELTAVQKLHYLNSSLKGDSRNVIKALELTNSNYAVAWKLINDRYENRRLIVGTHVAAMFNLTPLTKEGADELRKLVDEINTHLRALKALNQPTQYWDVLMIHLITSKLDTKSVKDWETTRIDDSIPTMTEFMTFLTQRCRTLESVEAAMIGKNNASKVTSEKRKHQEHATTKSNIRKRKWTNAFVTTGALPACRLCDSNHRLYQCDEFNKMEIPKRMAYVRSAGLCLNCLRPGHVAVECRSGTCLKCKKKHNTKLHLAENVEEPSVAVHQTPKENKPTTSNQTA